jgi:hypothetical protein
VITRSSTENTRFTENTHVTLALYLPRFSGKTAAMSRLS